MKKILAIIIGFLSTSAFAGIKTETIEYKDGKTVLEGFLAYNDSIKGPRPAVIIVHQWMGLSEHEKNSAKLLAEKGYVVLAADIYGKGVRPTNTNEAGKLAGQFKEDTKLFRAREKAAFDFLKKNKIVDGKKIVIMGYCFGGTGALEAARSGLPVVGAVSFHGGLATKTPSDAKNIKSKILVLHGAIDPYVSATEVDGFMKEMNDAKIDYQFISYSGAVHAFSQPEAGHDISKGAAYNENAARRSWQALLNFLDEVAPFASGDNNVEANKKTVTDFYNLAFNNHKPTEAAKKYIGNKYIQHNPHVPNGAAAFYNYFEGHFKKNPQSKAIIHRVIGDGDLVALHLHSKENDADLGRAIVDIFRLENGKIVEHFDVIQDVPEKTANGNSMFEGSNNK